ncbi:MAG: colanic acid biosynthesis glycosyl transferase WcaI [Actinomycetota bacterium]|nr:colanic acid biosynthesis glycosyl transferase WcaI [Actinomycetota bacterium]
MSAAKTPGSLVAAALAPTGRETVVVPRTRDGDIPSFAGIRGLSVLVIGMDYLPAPAPIAPYTTATAEHLASLGARVTVLTGLPTRPDGRPAAPYRVGLRCVDPAWSTPEAPRVVRLRHLSARRRGLPRRPWGQALRELTFLVAAILGSRSSNADLIVAVTPSPGGAAAAARLAVRRGVPLVTIVQGTTATANRADAPDPATRVATALERFALRHSDEVAVTSEAFLPAVRGAGVVPERIHLLPNWARIRRADESRVAARAALGWPPGRFTVVRTGLLDPGHDLETVVEAARLLHERGMTRFGGRDEDGDDGPGPFTAPVDIVLVGDGSRRAALTQQAFGLNGIRFVDPVDEDVAPLLLAAADVLLVSRCDTTSTGATPPADPGQLATYLAAGRPVLAAVPASGPVAFELRRTGGAGVRIGPGDPVALAEALLRMQASPSRRAAMGRAGLRYARAHLGREASMRRLELVLDTVVGRTAAGSPAEDC